MWVWNIIRKSCGVLPENGNGCSWARSDGALGEQYIITRLREKDLPDDLRKEFDQLKRQVGKSSITQYIGNGRVLAIRLDGLRKNPISNTIRQDIRDSHKGDSCALTGSTRHLELDHKDGRKDDQKVNDPVSQHPEDFQNLTKESNDLKRSRCSECKKTGVRFDARTLGFPFAQIGGGQSYRGTCVGCFWFDPREFRKAISADFTPISEVPEP